MDIVIMVLLIINAAAFLLMLADKRKAKQNRFRIPEAVLLSFAALGGSLGVFLGMRLFHHKTRKPKFSIGLPLLLAAQVLLLVFLLSFNL